MRLVRPKLEVALFRGSDAVSAGVLTAAELRTPRFIRLYRNAYVVRGTPITHELRCRAAALIVPEGCVLTGRSAATVRGVPLAAADDPVEMNSTFVDRARWRPGLRIRRVDVSEDESEPWEGIRIASSVRIAYDLLIGLLPLEKRVAYTDAWLRAGNADVEELSQLVEDRHDHGVRLGRAAMQLVDPRAESIPESELRVLLALAGLSPVPQLVVRNGSHFIARVDLGFEEERVAVEYDGAWHAEPNQLGRDRQRLNLLQENGWRVVSVTASALYSNPEGVVAAVQKALIESRRVRRVLAT
ncbi:endonuclease domain-containing protein [Allokutzneria sp. NRRL B-24872]|uniref:endonuclease domain-containing protein n=1 Tax=Allokutzneria sp. NRRL B-24872 TaxID=1137961 RepID=UPI00143D2919|nr:DUF559 domain-containing protein [Allokutzneria sp. NRRL B-24872]